MLTSPLARAFIGAIILVVGASCSEPTGGARNPVPVITAVSPQVFELGTTVLTLQVRGSGFVSSSELLVGGTPRTLSTLSDTLLGTVLLPADVASLGTLSVRVVNPAPGGGESASFTLAVDYLVPTLSQVAPDTVLRGSAAPQLTLTGTNFHPDSRVFIGSAATTTTFVNATTLRSSVPVSMGVAASHVVEVRQPAGQSASATFVVANRKPVIVDVDVDSLFRNSGATFLRLTGSDMVAGSSVTVNGQARTTAVQDSGTVDVRLLATDVANTGTLQLRVVPPSPSLGPSDPLGVTVVAEAPTITALDPPALAAGGPDSVIVVAGSAFPAGAVVRWNGADRATTRVSANTLRFTASATDLQVAGDASILVYDPARGLSSNSVALVLYPATAGITDTLVIDIPNTELVADPTRGVLYAAVPATHPTYGNRLLKLDPVTGAVLGSVLVGSSPRALSVSSDGAFLYVGRDGAQSVARIDLATFTADLDIPLPSGALGGTRAETVQAIPGQPTWVAVSLRYTCCSPRHQGVLLFRGDTLAPNRTQGHTGSNRIAALNGTTLVGLNNETTEFGLRTIAVNVDGLREVQVERLGSDFGAELRLSGSRAYLSSGQIVDLQSLLIAGTVPPATFILPDAASGRIHRLADSTLVSYYTSTLTAIASLNLAALDGLTRMVRVQGDGIAIGGGPRIVVLRGWQVAQ